MNDCAFGQLKRHCVWSLFCHVLLCILFFYREKRKSMNEYYTLAHAKTYIKLVFKVINLMLLNNSFVSFFFKENLFSTYRLLCTQQKYGKCKKMSMKHVAASLSYTYTNISFYRHRFSFICSIVIALTMLHVDVVYLYGMQRINEKYCNMSFLSRHCSLYMCNNSFKLFTERKYFISWQFHQKCLHFEKWKSE